MIAPPFAVGQSVIVSPPMTPLARHPGVIVRKAKYGWRVRYDSWGVMFTDTFSERALALA